MVLGVKLVKEDENEPIPVPFDVFVVRAMVGLVLLDQTIPLAVMEAPPSEVILPPDVAVVVVIADIEVVVSVGVETMENVSFRHLTGLPTDLTFAFIPM